MLNISPLAFYESILLQNHRRPYAFGQIRPLVIYKNELLPFQICLEGNCEVTKVILVSLQTNERKDITDEFFYAGGLYSDVKQGYTNIRYFATYPVEAISKEGLYYLELFTIVSGQTKVYYSEVFTSTNNIEGHICLTYTNSENFYFKKGSIDFSDDFKFKCFLPTQIGKPNYAFEEEAVDRFGYAFVESQVSKKIYNFTAVIPEYLCDALRIVRMCDTKKIEDDTRKVYDLLTFEMDIEWQEQGDLAAAKCSFETDTIITNTSPLLTPTNFNDDFNEDFTKN